MIFNAHFLNGPNQRAEMFRINIRCDAMPQVENMTGAVTEGLQHFSRFLSNDIPGCQQDRRVHVALQRNLVADAAARLGQ